MTGKIRGALSVAAATAALGVLAPMTAVQAQAGFTPGAAGGGDPYFPDMGNGGYDAAHYGLRVDFDPATKAINARATVEATATQNLSSFDLDFLGPLTISRLTVDGRPASFRRTGAQELVITPHAGLRRGHRFTVDVSYAGVPQRIDDPALGISGWVATSDGATALSQPFGSATWYPVNDSTRDKATYDFAVSVPADSGLRVLANGEPRGTATTGGRTTYAWHDGRPTASELVTVAIGKFDVKDSVTPGGLRNITAVDPAAVTSPTASADFNAGTAGVIDWEQRVFGRYPFSSTGGIVDLAAVGYSLETQTRPTYAKSKAGAVPSATLLAHELGHQWYGDSVTPAQWRHIWLNEGFATYAEWLYTEQHGGRTAQQAFDAAYADPNLVWTGKVADPGRDHIFDDLVYTRGAMTLQRLRVTIGDAAFFRLLRDWPAQHRYGNDTTAEFTAFAQRYTHQNLTPLFHTWLDTEGKPTIAGE